jgi:hypothetical protein
MTKSTMEATAKSGEVLKLELTTRFNQLLPIHHE